MKPSLALCVLAFLVSTAVGADGSQRGIEVADIDRKAAPCDDFFAYANDAWRTANPIPASMPRWSRRWAAGEANKDQLILEAAATAQGGKSAKGSVGQRTGDFYASCMDEARIDRPLKPRLAEIAALKDSAGPASDRSVSFETHRAYPFARDFDAFTA